MIGRSSAVRDVLGEGLPAADESMRDPLPFVSRGSRSAVGAAYALVTDGGGVLRPFGCRDTGT